MAGFDLTTEERSESDTDLFFHRPMFVVPNVPKLQRNNAEEKVA
jgi:hypothetical protein